MTRRILVVDDDRAMVKTLCDIFRLRGWEPHAAYSGKEAVDLHKVNPFSVVLMDIKMPEMDGITASKVMKRDNADLRIFLMTAHIGPYAVREVMRDGEYLVVQKPIDLQSLLAMLE
jgi:DNA-binding NtrC family response regulator